MSFDNPIVGFQHGITGFFYGFNYILQDGSRSDLALKYNNNPSVYVDATIQKNQVVRRVVMNAGGAAGMMNGVQFFDEEDKCILTAGRMEQGGITKQFTLTPEERIVGIKSNLVGGRNSCNSPRQYEFQLIIGWME